MKWIVENCYGHVVQTFHDLRKAKAWLKTNAKTEGETPYCIYECRIVHCET